MFRKTFVFTAVVAIVPAACELQAAAWKFVATGDSRGSTNGVNATIAADIAHAIVAEDAEFAVWTGDLWNGSSTESGTLIQLNQWRSAVAPLYDAGIGVYPVAGNHEWSYAGLQSLWYDSFPDLPTNGPAGEERLTYSLSHKNAFVVAADQYSGHSHRVNQAWIDSQFAANDLPHVFSFGHEPAFEVDHNDCLDDYPSNRDAFWDSLKDEGSRVYFAGHDHFYDHARVDDGDGDADNDLHQYVVGTAGAPLRNWTPPYIGSNSGMNIIQVDHDKSYGYVLVEIDGLDATLTYKQRVSPGNFVAGDIFTYTAVPETGADFDNDGDVDGADFLKWQRGRSPRPLSQSDLNDWKANYGVAAPLSAASAAVPEPGSLAPLLVGSGAFFFCRRTAVS